MTSASACPEVRDWQRLLAGLASEGEAGPLEQHLAACVVCQLLNLADEQKTKIGDIRKEYRPKVHEASNKLRAAVREEMEQIAAVIKE